MPKPKFILDENLPNSTVEVFTRQGLDASHVRLKGLFALTDKKLIELAKREGRVLVTRDLEFGNLINYPLKSHRGIIVLRLPETYTVRQINKTLEEFLRDVTVSELERALVIVEPKRYRVRKK